MQFQGKLVVALGAIIIPAFGSLPLQAQDVGIISRRPTGSSPSVPVICLTHAAVTCSIIKSYSFAASG